MLRPEEMRELRIITLDEDVDRVIKRLDALGSVHLTDVKEFMDDWSGLIEPAKTDPTVIKTSELLARMSNLIALLQPTEAETKKSLKDKLFGAERKQPRVVPREYGSLAEIESYFNRVDKTVNTLRDDIAKLRDELADTEDLLHVLTELKEFGVEPGFIGDQHFITVFAGELPETNLEELETALDNAVGELHFVCARTGEGRAFAIVVVMKRDRAAVEKLLTRMDFNSWVAPSDIPPDDTVRAIEEVKAKLKRLQQDITQKEREIAELRESKLAELVTMREFVQIEDTKAKVKMLFGQTERVRVIEGWTPEKNVAEVTSGITEETGGFSVVEVSKPGREDVRVPSLLNNPKILKPFESVIKMYGHPSYRDIDPTLITAVIFPILFGLMFPDIGHGFILMLLGLALTRFTGLGKGTSEMGVIILLCGLCSLIAGVIFGEFFGFSAYAGELIKEALGVHVPDWLILIKHPLLEPLVQVKLFFVITLLIGFAHMGLGLGFNVMNHLRERDMAGLITGLVKIWCLAGALYFLLLLFGFYFTELQDNNISVLLRNAGVLVLLPIVLLFGLRVKEELGHESGEGKKGIMNYLIILIDGVIDALLENFFRFLANVVSYGRIMALALCHAALIEVFLIFTFMCLSMPVPVLSQVLAAVVFIFGTVLVIVLEAIMAGIHTIRLHFYEWFTKFYEGNGHEFTPFRLRGGSLSR